MEIDIYLRPRESRQARITAKRRNRSFEESENFDNYKDTWGLDPEERNYIGALGEFAIAKHYDLTVNSEIVQRTDGGYDFKVLFDDRERTIDVKCTKHDPKWLSEKEGKVTADYYLLSQVVDSEWNHVAEKNAFNVEEPNVRLIGAATKEMVKSAPLKKSPRYDHRNRVIRRSTLREPPEVDRVEGIDDVSTPSYRGHRGGPRQGSGRIS